MKNNKKRLYEIFSKVNRLTLNEQDVKMEMGEIHQQIKNDVLGEFSDDLFKDGVPSTLTYNVMGEIKEFQMVEDNPLQFKGVRENQLQYIMNYVANILNMNVYLSVELTVEVNPTYTYEKYEFIPQVMAHKNDIEISFKQ